MDQIDQLNKLLSSDNKKKKYPSVKEYQEKNEKLINHYKLVFASEMAKTVLDDLRKITNFDDVCHCDNPHDTSFKLGQRSIMLYIYKMIGDAN